MTRALQENPLVTTQRRVLDAERTQTEESRTDAPQIEGSLARLRASAADSPSTRNLNSLQRKADARGQMRPPPRAPMRGVASDLPLPSLQRKSKPGATATSSLAMTTALSPSATHDPSLIPVPNGDAIALQRVATSAQEPMPGQPTAVDSPVLNELGMSATTMSNAEYKRWSGTVQCKMGMHGKQQIGDRTIVTQFKPNSGVLQLAGISKFFKKHKAKFSAGLVMFEAALTIGAAIAGIAIAVNTGALNVLLSGAAGIIVGVMKMIRGAIMMHQAFQPPDKKSELAADAITLIRSLEAVGAAIALFLAAPTSAITIVSGMVFAASKGMRSLSLAYKSYAEVRLKELEEEGKNGKKNEDESEDKDAITSLRRKIKFAGYLAQACHWLEVIALAVGGSNKAVEATIEAAKTGSTVVTGAKFAGGLGANVIATSKGLRNSALLPDKKADPLGPDEVTADDEVAKQDDSQLKPNSLPDAMPQALNMDEGDMLKQ